MVVRLCCCHPLNHFAKERNISHRSVVLKDYPFSDVDEHVITSRVKETPLSTVIDYYVSYHRKKEISAILYYVGSGSRDPVFVERD